MTMAGITAARDELTWYFASSGEVLGLHAAALDTSGGKKVYDEARSHADHVRRRKPEHRRDVARAEAVRQRLASLTVEQQQVLVAGYTPFGAARCNWRTQRVFHSEGWYLLGLVLTLPETVSAFRVTHDTDVEPTSRMLVRWLERETQSTNESSVPVTLRKLRDVAIDVLRGATTAYGELRIEDLTAAKRAREAMLEDELERVRQRLWGEA